MYSTVVIHATTQSIYHHRLLWTASRAAARYVPSRQSLPFAVIGTMAYCSRTNLDDRRRPYQPQIIAIYITSVRDREFLRMPQLQEFIRRDIATFYATETY